MYTLIWAFNIFLQQKSENLFRSKSWHYFSNYYVLLKSVYFKFDLPSFLFICIIYK